MDVCNASGIKNPRDAKKRLDQAYLSTTEVLEGENKRLDLEHVDTIDVLAGDNKKREVAILNESGLYDVILDSRKQLLSASVVG